MKIDNLKISAQMVYHIAFTTEHNIKYEYRIIAPDNLVNGRKFYSETVTKKRANSYNNFGKSNTFYYFQDTPKGKEFKSMKDLLASINIDIP